MRPREFPLQDKVRFLSAPRTYGVVTDAVRAIETHFAWVFLAGEDAYKLKKPLRHQQIDYRRLAARERGCREEVLLNRRFARGIYRGVVPLTAVDGALALGGAGHIVDWLVKMRRLPDERMLDRALESRKVTGREIRRVAHSLVRMYRRAEKRPMSASRYVVRLGHQIRENRRIIERYVGRLPQKLVCEVFEAQHVALECLRPTLSARGASVVDGHGDLRAEHVYLGPRIAVIDALEFDPMLRLLDPAEEIALLALEIERLGHSELARELEEEFCGAIDPPPTASVMTFYKSHRAAARAKLAAWHLGDPQFPDAAPWIARTISLLDDALRYAQATVRRPLGASAEEAVRAVHRRRFG